MEFYFGEDVVFEGYLFWCVLFVFYFSGLVGVVLVGVIFVFVVSVVIGVFVGVVLIVLVLVVGFVCCMVMIYMVFN